MTATEPKRYAPTKVERRTEAGDLIEEYEDATVSDMGDNRPWGGAKGVMLRAYSPDPDFFGDAAYQAGNGIHFDPKEGYVMDCDSDIALRRIIGTVLSRSSLGHCEEVLYVLVCRDRDKDEWNGMGHTDVLRIERWYVYIAADEDD